MANNTLIAVAAVFALLAVGGVVGYALSQNDIPDSSDGETSSEINTRLQSYADDLKQYGGKIYTNANGISIPKGTNVTVSNGNLVCSLTGGTCYFPHTGISYIVINK